ncbi:hypothetical protein ASPZODRAFT_57391 [Penicilliopsis zonata CBS 506.65]|uniref:ABC transmembrane type-1 domain-containing protein n=1 Tax=Penicilliopsis zonata CBS 506.65 TaxID=1073090 RepID=A0A1L9SXB7_9EURO|nr:hypothetical protein ASPZODRAFT_57391 [Penicilliopsis zonata CBS 506.65]OJJ51777.1 hypothetical protein ASPZODRAFT_57391 [Penicilliopsis zonata CBS 506.65]
MYGENSLCLPYSHRNSVDAGHGTDWDFIFQSLLICGPSVVFLLCAPWTCLQLRKESIKVRQNYRGFLKLLTSLVLLALQLSRLVLELLADPHSIRYVSATALEFACSLAISFLSFVHHGRSISPSDLLNVYLATSIGIDIAKAVLLSITTAHECNVSMLSIALMAVKTVLLGLETQSKRSILREPWTSQNLSFEETDGVFSRITFWRVNALLQRGRKQLLKLDDLPTLHSELSSSLLRERMRVCWERRSKPEGRYALVVAVFKCTFWQNMRVAPYVAVQVFLRYAQPLLITYMITFVSDPPPAGDAYCLESFKLILSVMVIYVGLAIVDGLRSIAARKVRIAVRACLIGVLHDKALKSIASTSDDSSAITLSSSDVEDVQWSIGYIHTIWSSFLSLGLGMYMLASRLGWASVIPILLVLFTSRGGKYVSQHFAGKQRAWNDATQARIGITKTVLEQMKSIKMCGFSRAMETRIQNARENEIKASLITYWLDAILIACVTFLNVVGPAITLAIYAIHSKLTGGAPLDTNTAFTSFAIIQMVTAPANSIILSVPDLVAALAGFDRLQKYLLEPSHEDTRRILTEAGPDGVNKIDSVVTATSIDSQDEENNRTFSIVVKNATIRPSPTAREPVLQGINIQVQKGWLVICAGVTGSGKTTLARAILGDVQPDSGSISVSSKNIACCTQSSWLRNGTIQEIIAGPPGSQITDVKWYQRVIHACCLEEDFQQLPRGDQTMVASGGTSLSGGQKQRVALARAVYSRLDILVLDDIFSALDTQTEQTIAQRLFGQHGLLRELEKTVFLITHATHLLPLSDLVVILNKDGHVSKQGPWDELKGQAESISRMIDSKQNEQKVSSSSEAKTQNKAAAVASLRSAERSMEMVRKTGDSAIYKQYINAVGKPQMLVTTLVMASSAGFSLLIQNWLRWWTADGQAEQHTWFYVSGYLLLALAHWVSLAGINATLLLIVPSSGRALHGQLLSTVMKAPLSFFTSSAEDTGTTLSRFSQDMKHIDRRLPTQVARMGGQAFKLLAQFLLLYTAAQSSLLVTLPILLAVVYVVQKVYLYTSRQLRWLDLETNSLTSTSFLDTVNGLTTIRAFGWETAYMSDNSRRLDMSQIPSYSLLGIEQWLQLVLDLIIAAVALINVSLVIFQGQSGGGSTAGEVGITMNVFLSVNITLLVTIHFWTSFDASLEVVSRIAAFAREVKPEAQPGEDHVPPEEWPARGGVEMQDVVAGYGGSSNSSSSGIGDGITTALNGVTLTIPPSSKTGIRGRTGSGKSSLILSILRLLDFSKGTICIDGVDLATLPRETIRHRIITIPQDPFLIPSGSLRENLDVGSGTVSDEEMLQVLHKVHLASVLERRDASLPLDTMMKDLPLSAGQIQLLSLARAILLRPSRGNLLLLDEATSNIDRETDAVMQRVLREEFRGYTVAAIAHRLETIEDADNVLVMEGGRVLQGI